MKKILFALAFFGITLFASPSAGEPFPSTTLETQFDKKQSVTMEDKLVIMSFERDVSDKINAFLKKQPKGFLEKHHAKYIADISAMPVIISKLFALPKMRDYPYAIMLNRDDNFKKKYDKKEGKATVYHLGGGKVVSVEFIDPEKIGRLFSK